MLKKAVALWKRERNRKNTTLHRRLLLFFILISVSLILVFTLLLSLFGITGKQDETVRNHLTTELTIITDKIDTDFGRISLDGIAMAETIAERSDEFFRSNNISASELQMHPELIEPLLATHIQTLISTANNRSCGGVYVMLDATVNPDAADAQYAKAGIFLKKTTPNAISASGVDMHCLRGPASIARDNGIMLIGQWRMEYNISDQAFFTTVIQTARDNPDLELSRLYYWSGRVTLNGNSESGFLLCVPLRSADGTVFGLCGIEVSDRLFKSSYTPEGGVYDNIFTVMAPDSENGLRTATGLLAGNSYLTGKNWSFDLVQTGSHDGFVHFEAGDQTYGGKTSAVRLYPNGSPYTDNTWSVATLMPYSELHAHIEGSTVIFIWIVVGLLALSLCASFVISRRYIQPVNEALDAIRTTPHDAPKATPYAEINEVFEYLAVQARAHRDEVDRLHGEKTAVQSQYERVQTYVTHLADERMPQVDEYDFAMFLQNLHTLTPKEREIFDHYLTGKKAKEIMELSGINQNTLKYHNKNIYSKLGVSSRKQLLAFAALMKYGKEG